MERRLSAILSADVVGFTRLMGANEAATLAALKMHRRELVDSTIAAHQGRIVKLIGDGILVEFPSVVNAVACATEIQRAMRDRNNGVPEDRRIEFRIGVNLGDVIVDENDIYGDGVNLAVRIEGVARPGGIAVSGTVRDHIGNRLDIAFEDMGEHKLKNIARPVRIYGVPLPAGPAPAGRTGPDRTPKDPAPRTAAPADRKPAPGTAKPSIAVLPFNNMSGDPEQEYFADGITEDIITDLSKVSGLSVIGRNSVFTYKGKPAEAREVSERFKVTTILEGSVRKSGQRVRINAQLINGADGMHLWADRYDRDLTDIFALQDEITETIVAQLKVRLLPREKLAISAAPTQNLDAYNYYLQGRRLYHFLTKPHALMAQRLFRKAVELDPGYARAYAGLADCAGFLYRNQMEGVTVEDIMSASAKALELDASLAEAHASHGLALHYAGHRKEAIAAFERAIALDSNLGQAYDAYATAALDGGDRETAVRMYARAAELVPDDFGMSLMQAQMLRELGRHAEYLEATRSGLERAERALAAHPDVARPAALGAAALAILGDHGRAREWANRALMIDPDDPLTQYNIACVYALIGEADRALDALERWAPRRNATTAGHLVHDSDFDSIRDHPRFRKLLESTPGG